MVLFMAKYLEIAKNNHRLGCLKVDEAQRYELSCFCKLRFYAIFSKNACNDTYELSSDKYIAPFSLYKYNMQCANQVSLN